MQLYFKIHKSLDEVFDYLADMQKFVSVHPLISQMDKTGNDRYLVHETLKIGFIPFSFTYPVTVEKNTLDKTVIMKAVVFQFTRIEIKFVLKADKDYTIIDEVVNFTSPLPVKFILERIFKEQHEKLFQNIEATR